MQKNQDLESRDEKKMPFEQFSRQTDIVAYRVVVCNSKGSPRVH